jgi:hypothetical protein
MYSNSEYTQFWNTIYYFPLQFYSLNNKQTNYNSRSATQEIPRILCNLEVHSHAHMSPPLVPILSQIKPIHLPFYFVRFHFNITLPSKSTTF